MQPIAYVALITTLLASTMGLVSANETKDTYVTIPPHSANGTCSSQPVNNLEFFVLANTENPLASVFTVDKATYDAALSSNLTDAQIAQRSTQFSNRDCYTPGTEITTCSELLDANTPTLDPQIMCILLTNARDVSSGAYISHTWYFDNTTSSNSSSNTKADTSSSASFVASSIAPLAMGSVLLALSSSTF
ncbi:MAG: hypothetical protein DHS80DRAFT_24249 [Piptocephalis tieghemiana]|nr:MAG: hypothetical protein DHS80DRAFT_24249 [Piptocephalis tieghemiana]